MYQQSLNHITVTPFSYHKCSQDVTSKTACFYSNTGRNMEAQLSSWIPDETAHHSRGSPGEFPRPCMSVRQQGNLTGLSLLLCKMKGLGQMASAITDSMIFQSPRQVLDSAPTEIFHFYLFLSPRLKSVNLIGNHQKKLIKRRNT